MTLIQTLIDLQEVDGRIRELELELKDLPRRRAAEEARLKGVGADLRSAKANEEYASQRVRNYEEEAKSLREQLTKLKTTQAGLKTNREYQQYSLQIDLVNHELETTENSQLAAMDDLPSAQAKISEAETKYNAEKSGVDAYCQEINERIAAVKEELEVLRKERQQKAALVDNPMFMLTYERLRTKRWPVVVQITHDGVCDGCHLMQPPSVAQMVAHNSVLKNRGESEKIVQCTMCGRILYRD